ncbi:MAG: TPM domain-containing protein, partial [Flavobacteriales bacterium]
MRKLRTLLLLVSIAFSALVFAAEVDPCFPPKPKNEDQLVFQFTKFLSPQEVEFLNNKLVHFAQETSNRIAVVAVDTLCGYPPSDFAFEL